MSGRPVTRRGGSGHARRTRPIRRASAGLTPVRAGALLAMLGSAAAIYGVAASSAFGLNALALEGVAYTEEAAIRTTLAVPDGVNLFSLQTDDLEAALHGLPTVARAEIAVNLPDTLRVRIEEREPILTWAVGERRFLVDAAGRLFAELADPPPADAPSLPVLQDRRSASRRLATGDRLDPVDLDAATRLGSLTPADVGSGAAALGVAVTDEEGFVLATEPEGWTAIFGFYTPSLRTPELVAGQVRLLRSLLTGREAEVARVILASDTDGTFVPKPSPDPSP